MGATVLSGLGGYLVGPPLGAAAWRLYNRKWSRALEEMDTRFYAHVAKNRADPGRQTLSSRCVELLPSPSLSYPPLPLPPPPLSSLPSGLAFCVTRTRSNDD